MPRRMIDYQNDEETDLKIVGGDFVRGESTLEHMERLIVSAKGEYGQSPLTGADATNYLDGDPTELLREITMQLVRDGMTVGSIGQDADKKFKVKAEYR